MCEPPFSNEERTQIHVWSRHADLAGVPILTQDMRVLPCGVEWLTAVDTPCTWLVMMTLRPVQPGELRDCRLLLPLQAPASNALYDLNANCLKRSVDTSWHESQGCTAWRTALIIGSQELSVLVPRNHGLVFNSKPSRRAQFALPNLSICRCVPATATSASIEHNNFTEPKLPFDCACKGTGLRMGWMLLAPKKVNGQCISVNSLLQTRGGPSLYVEHSN